MTAFSEEPKSCRIAANNNSADPKDNRRVDHSDSSFPISKSNKVQIFANVLQLSHNSPLFHRSSSNNNNNNNNLKFSKNRHPFNDNRRSWNSNSNCNNFLSHSDSSLVLISNSFPCCNNNRNPFQAFVSSKHSVCSRSRSDFNNLRLLNHDNH